MHQTAVVIPSRWAVITGNLHADGVYWGILAMLVTAAAVILYLGDPAQRWRLRILQVVAAGWAIIPPAFFMIEWWSLPASIVDASSTGVFEEFKYDQETAKDLWAGIGAVLALILVKS